MGTFKFIETEQIKSSKSDIRYLEEAILMIDCTNLIDPKTEIVNKIKDAIKVSKQIISYEKDMQLYKAGYNVERFKNYPPEMLK